MYIPEFEFNKDSYILKHKLDYNTRCDGDFSGITYGILFTDYDLARKTQSKNAELFHPLNIEEDIENVVGLIITKYDISHTILFFGRWFNTELVLSGDTLFDFDSDSGATFISTNEYQQYYVPSGSTALLNDGDLFNVYFHIIEEITGTTNWSHFGPAGETWVATGTTANGIPFQATGTTTVNGYSSGTATYNVIDYTPILKYSAKSLEIGDDYIKLERRLEDFIVNNIMKLAKDYDFNNVSYTIESLHFSDDSYYGVKYILEETFWSDYFSISSTSNSLTFTPIPNKKDLYFDYDNLEVQLLTTGDTITYGFDSECLYAKYKLDRFLEQYDFSISGTSINFDEICDTDLSTPPISIPPELNNPELYRSLYFDVYLNDIDDADYFTPYTYIYASTSGQSYISLIVDIKDNVLTLLIPLFGFLDDDQIISVQNLHTIEDISKMLYEVFINIEEDFTQFGDFYLGDYFDPVLIGQNIIDPNAEGPWVFDPS